MFGGIGKGFISNEVQSVTYISGDRIRITEPADENYGMVGTIMRVDPDDGSYLIEFEYDTPFGPTKNTSWYHNSIDFVYANKPSYVPKQSNTTYCWHEWKEDKWFTSKIFKYCKKCGVKPEDA